MFGGLAFLLHGHMFVGKDARVPVSSRVRVMDLGAPDMFEIIDLSQEIFSGMPVFPGLPNVEITMHVSHEQWDGITGSDVVSPAVNRMELGEHTGTHVDAINHMARQYTVLLYTDHYRRAFGTADWFHGPGVSIEAARWLSEQGIAAFGVETASAGVMDVSNKEVHWICG
jgi:kynurenine formamidase